LFEQILRLVVIVAGIHSGFDIGQRGLETVEVRLLRKITNGCTGLHKAGAAISFHKSRHDLQQCRFARAVAADQAHAFACRDRKLDAGEQRRTAERQRNVFQLDQGGAI
jgi:hypothetical protein